jgi:hypothetical protein
MIYRAASAVKHHKSALVAARGGVLCDKLLGKIIIKILRDKICWCFFVYYDFVFAVHLFSYVARARAPHILLM